MFESTDYTIFFEFIRNYSGSGFRDINNQDHFMARLNRVLHNGRQFIWIADITSLELIFTSQQVTDFFGIEPEKYNLSHNLTRTHPLDQRRRSIARARIVENGHNLYNSKAGNQLLSFDFRIRNSNEEYINTFVQCYLFYSNSPAETVYLLVVNTMMDDTLSKYLKTRFFHWYSGNDLAFFRYPDEELLQTGSSLSERELEILRHIHKGMSSKEISNLLSLSLHTINTHRRNILKKTGKSSIGEVIYGLEAIGVI